MSLIFEKTSVEQAKHMLVRLLRLILYKKRVTFDDFLRCHNRYSKACHVNPKDAHTDRSNHWKLLSRVSGITFQKMHHILVSIFRWDIIRFSITIVDIETGEITVFNSDDPVD